MHTNTEYYIECILIYTNTCYTYKNRNTGKYLSISTMHTLCILHTNTHKNLPTQKHDILFYLKMHFSYVKSKILHRWLNALPTTTRPATPSCRAAFPDSLARQPPTVSLCILKLFFVSCVLKRLCYISTP